ncbi:MAG: biotin transporter BioY [candidate division WOR-3 bacterium]
MNIEKTLEFLNNGKILYFTWLKGLNWIKRLGLSLLFALLTGIFAQIRIPLGFTPVPVTGQVFVVLLSGVLLGGFYAGMSMVFYLTLGAIGVPLFAGFRAGLNFGPTLGYLLGFIPAAIFVGIFAHKQKRLFKQILIMLIGIFLIYLVGAFNFAVLMKTNFYTTLKLAVLPFIPFDIAKAIIAGFLSRLIIPDDRI